ncbi:unnamed protein product [Urochloa decumbens]|uniref:Uncharacterized protein n=1 Tax=Urochloa decumbens TaxID=240449 RepID=A0ABC8YWD1_9POAL
MAEVADVHTLDGTVDRKGNPAVKLSTGNWRSCLCILASGCMERLAYYGMSTNLVIFMTTRLGQANSTATNNVTNWTGTSYITPLLGALLADSYMGRFCTIATFMIIYMAGLALLTVASSVKGLVPSCEKGVCNPTEGQTAAVFVALYLIALGSGGMKPCTGPFGADQFDDNDEAEKRSKVSIFNWSFFCINAGAMASIVLVYVQTHVGWGWGFGIPTMVMGISIVSFFIGTPLYRHQRPGGSPFTRIAQVLVASARKWSVAVPAAKSQLHESPNAESGIQGRRKLEHSDQFRFLDKAAVVTAEDVTVASAWRLCTVTQVEELKSVVRLLPILASGIVFQTVCAQMSTMFVLQGNTMDQRMGPKFSIPPAALIVTNSLSIVILVPVYDRLILPAVRSFTGRPGGFTQLQRMGIGLIISTFSMLAAGVLEVVRLRVVARHGLYGEKDVVPISIFWQTPLCFIIGFAEVFTNVGLMEFFYDQAPDAMRSMCSALSLTTAALGSYLSTVLVTIVTRITTRHGKLGWIPDNLNRGHLDYFYWLLAVISFLNFLVYLVIASWYKYKKTAQGDRNAEP